MFEIDDWYISGSENKVEISNESDNESLIVTILSSKPAYLVYKREDANFGIAPSNSALTVDPSTWTLINLDIASDQEANMRLGATVYLQDESKQIDDEKTWGNSTSLSFFSPKDSFSNSIYVRFSKPGIYELKDFVIHSSLRELSDSKVLYPFERPSEYSGKLNVSFSSYSEADSKATTLVTVDWMGKDGKRIAGIPDRATNPIHGPYEYILNNSLNEFEFQVPKGAVRGAINFIPWKGGSRVFITDLVNIEFLDPDQEVEQSNSAKLCEVLENVPSDKKIIVLHTTAPPLGHSTLSLRPNRLAVEFEELGCFVIFLPFSTVPEGINKYDDNAVVVCRSLWPVLQLELAKREQSDNVMVCTSFPNFEAMSALDLLGMSGWTTIYEIRDDMEEFNRVGYSKWFNPQLEKYIAERADAVVAVSPRLATKGNIIANRDDAIVSPNAVSDFLYEAGKSHRTIDFQNNKYGSKTIGYLGHLTDSWFDWRAIIAVATTLQEYNFRIIGHGIPERLKDNLPQNVEYLGPMDHANFIEESKTWSVGLIPFKISPLTFGVDPNKLYEYLALGVRVVSAPMGSVDSAPFTTVYRNTDELKNQIVEQAGRRMTSQEISDLEDYLAKSRWTYRAGQMMDIFKAASDA